jgi:hypothetical protein
LRQEIQSALNGDSALVPGGTLQKANDRILQAVRKNAALDMEQYSSLDRKLEYFDVRDLQEVIVSRGLWARFEHRFANKDNVQIKFGQLAELRNSIRHSRSVDEITRKEGEAAILWFTQVLGKEAGEAINSARENSNG